jgi:Protein of unknown function (DUF4232)
MQRGAGFFTEGIAPMALKVRIVQNSLTGGIMVIAAILAVGCGSHGSGSSGQATSQAPTQPSSPVPSSPGQSSVAAASTPASAAASTPANAASRASSPSPASRTGAGAASAASCSTSNLRIVLGVGGAAAGTDFTVLDFTNIGTGACTLHGFPGVSLVNSSGAQIGAAATRNPVNASTRVTLAPGAKANATLGVANAGNYPASACKPTPAAQLKVFPPNQTEAIVLPFTALGCAVSSAHQLSVTAVTAGAGHAS